MLALPSTTGEDFNEAITLDPQGAEAYNSRGFSFYKLGQFDQALKSYDESIRLDPENARAYYNKSQTYYTLGQQEPAVENRNLACKLDDEYC